MRDRGISPPGSDFHHLRDGRMTNAMRPQDDSEPFSDHGEDVMHPPFGDSSSENNFPPLSKSLKRGPDVSPRQSSQETIDRSVMWQRSSGDWYYYWKDCRNIWKRVAIVARVSRILAVYTIAADGKDHYIGSQFGHWRWPNWENLRTSQKRASEKK